MAPEDQYPAWQDGELADAGGQAGLSFAGAGVLDGRGGQLQQVGPGPDAPWRADQPLSPRPTLKAPAARPIRPGRLRRALASSALIAATLLVLGGSEGRTAVLANIERAAVLAGLGLRQVTLSGHRFTADHDIFAALELDGARTLLSFNARAARARIERLPWIEWASIDRAAPDRIDVRVAERTPFAVWRSGEGSWLIDRTGRKLQLVPTDAMPDLLRVAGEGAPEEAAALAATLANHPRVADRIAFAERIGARRWTLHLVGGTIAQLPAAGESEALARLARLIDGSLGNVKSVDLRVSARVLVREARDGDLTTGQRLQAPDDRT